MLDDRYRDKMGLINNDDFKFASGAQQSQTYLKLSGPAFMYADASSDTGYLAKTTLEIYYDKAARDSGLVPMQIENLVIPVDPTGVYAIMYAGLKNRYSNTANVPTDIDTPTAPPASAQPAPEAQPSTDSSTEQAASEQPATEQPATEQPASEQPATEQPTAEQPASDQPQPATEQPATEQPAAEQPAAEQPAAEQPATEQPANE